MEEKKKIVAVLLTRYSDRMSDVLYYINGRGFTHAAIALDDENEYFYSFNIKGFRREYPKRHKNRSKNSVIIKLEVSEECFERMKRRIEAMERIKDKLHYSLIGLMFCCLHIPFKLRNHYFCSQFVAEVLKLSDRIVLSKDNSLYLPNSLLDELCKQSCLNEIVYDPI